MLEMCTRWRSACRALGILAVLWLPFAGCGGSTVSVPFTPLLGTFPQPPTITIGPGDTTIHNTSRSDHPHHQHVNPFLLTHINGVPLPVPEWRDTVLVPAATASNPVGSVTLRMHYHPDITGVFVAHCHILTHEDIGMMQVSCPQSACHFLTRSRRQLPCLQRQAERSEGCL